jgi:hypothetical protein
VLATTWLMAPIYDFECCRSKRVRYQFSHPHPPNIPTHAPNLDIHAPWGIRDILLLLLFIKSMPPHISREQRLQEFFILMHILGIIFFEKKQLPV